MQDACLRDLPKRICYSCSCAAVSDITSALNLSDEYDTGTCQDDASCQAGVTLDVAWAGDALLLETASCFHEIALQSFVLFSILSCVGC